MEKILNIKEQTGILEKLRKLHEKLKQEKKTEPERIQVLVVDDEERSLHAFQRLFRREFDVFVANSAHEAIEFLGEKEMVHVIITDQRMPGMTGIEFLQSILTTHPDPIRILLTGYTDVEAVVDAINKGEVYRYIAKPFMKSEMKQTIESAYEIYSLRKKVQQLENDMSFLREELKELTDENG